MIDPDEIIPFITNVSCKWFSYACVLNVRLHKSYSLESLHRWFTSLPEDEQINFIEYIVKQTDIETE